MDFGQLVNFKMQLYHQYMLYYITGENFLLVQEVFLYKLEVFVNIQEGILKKIWKALVELLQIMYNTFNTLGKVILNQKEVIFFS